MVVKKGVYHKINVTNTQPINIKPYPIPHALREETRKENAKLLRLQIIKESKSPYCSPAFPIHKKNGKIRLVIDYRKLNLVTVPINCSFLRIQDYLQDLGKSKLFSQIDLNMGYCQIEIAPEDTFKSHSNSIMDTMNLFECHLGYPMLREPFNTQ